MSQSIDLVGSGMTSQRTRDRMISRLREQGIDNEQVLSVMRTTPRHIFLDEALSHGAYEDNALPIGFNQTISQPYTVAKMTELLLASGPLQSVLEVGTGSGYQTAVLAPLVKQVYSVERIQPLQQRAKQRLEVLAINNVSLQHADGGMGWPAKAPFDGIIVTACPTEIPQQLLEQLAVGGRLVTPVGSGSEQQLKLVVKVAEGDYQHQVLEPANFVPLLDGTIQ